MGGWAKTIARGGALGVVALALTGCLKLDMDLSVATDDTVSGDVVFAVDKQLLELSGQSAEDLLGTAAALPSDVQGVSAQPYEDDTFAGQQFTFDAVSLEQFNQESGSADQLRIVREGDTFVVTGVLDLSSALSGATGANGFPGAEELFRSAEMRIRIAFPGEVIDTNGEVDGTTVTWVPTVGERLDIQATASAIEGGGGGSTMTILLIVAGVVIVAAIVVGLLLARRRRPAVAMAGFGAEGSAPPTAPEASPTQPISPASAPTEPTPPTSGPPEPTRPASPPASPPAPPAGPPPPPPPPDERT